MNVRTYSHTTNIIIKRPILVNVHVSTPYILEGLVLCVALYVSQQQKQINFYWENNMKKKWKKKWKVKMCMRWRYKWKMEKKQNQSTETHFIPFLCFSYGIWRICMFMLLLNMNMKHIKKDIVLFVFIFDIMLVVVISTRFEKFAFIFFCFDWIFHMKILRTQNTLSCKIMRLNLIWSLSLHLNSKSLL